LARPLNVDDWVALSMETKLLSEEKILTSNRLMGWPVVDSSLIVDARGKHVRVGDAVVVVVVDVVVAAVVVVVVVVVEVMGFRVGALVTGFCVGALVMGFRVGALVTGFRVGALVMGFRVGALVMGFRVGALVTTKFFVQRTEA
jgi:hypothetical protein